MAYSGYEDAESGHHARDEIERETGTTFRVVGRFPIEGSGLWRGHSPFSLARRSWALAVRCRVRRACQVLYRARREGLGPKSVSVPSRQFAQLAARCAAFAAER